MSYVYWLFGLSLLIPIWVGSHFPSEDGPAHLYWAQVYDDLKSPTSEWRELYERNTQWNVPYLSYLGADRALSAVLEPHRAQRGVITLLLLAWITAIWYLSVTINRRVTLGAVAALLLLHNSFLYSGYFSFLLSIPALIVGTALVHRIISSWESRAPSPVASHILLGAVGLVAYYSHLVIALLFVGVVFLAALVYGRRFPRRAAALAATALPTLAMVVTYVATDSFGGGGMQWMSARQAATHFVGLSFWRGFASPTPVFWATLLLADVVFATLCVGAARSWFRKELSASQRFVLFAGAALVLLFFVAPDSIGRSGDAVNRRIQLAAWAVLLPALPSPTGRRARGFVLAATSLLLGWQLVDFSLKIHRYNVAYESVLAQAALIPRGSVIRSVHPYEDASFENSFVKVLGEFQADVAYHCRCVLVQAHAPSTAHYWVRTRPGATAVIDFDLDLDRSMSSRRSPTVMPTLDAAASADRGTLQLVVGPSGERVDARHRVFSEAAR